MSSIATLTVLAFWSWTIFDCFQHERDKKAWLFIIGLLNLVGAVAYLLCRWLPRSSQQITDFICQDHHSSELQQAIAAARNIGKAHQFVKLGHLYRDKGKSGDALATYHQALSREPNNLEALWGCASIELNNQNLEQGALLLKRIVQAKADFKFGDASMAYGKALFQLGNFDAAEQHLTQHLQQWSHPEAALLMAKIKARHQNTQDARHILETMITDVQGSPAFHYRRHRQHLQQGKQLLNSLNRS